MTQEQKRVKLAEACGYEPTKTPSGVCWYNPNAEICSDGHVLWDVEELPDYFNDLNACHEALAILTDKQCYTFNSAISNLKPPRRDIKHPFEKWTWGSPADQYAEALGQILNLWEAGE